MTELDPFLTCDIIAAAISSGTYEPLEPTSVEVNPVPYYELAIDEGVKVVVMPREDDATKSSRSTWAHEQIIDVAIQLHLEQTTREACGPVIQLVYQILAHVRNKRLQLQGFKLKRATVQLVYEEDMLRRLKLWTSVISFTLFDDREIDDER